MRILRITLTASAVLINAASANTPQEFNKTECSKQSDAACRILGEQFADSGNPDVAIQWFNAAIEKQQNRKNYEALANFHLSTDNERDWLKTLETALKSITFDRLTDAQINHTIAKHFIETGEWEKARPYQEAAALRGYYWSLCQAAWLNAALGDTERGLMYVEQDTWYNNNDRLFTYILAFDVTPNEWDNALIDAFFEKHGKGSALDRSRCASIALIRNDYATAVRLRTESLQLSNDPWHAVFAALICEEQGWYERRDSILQEAIERWAAFYNKTENRTNVRKFIDLYIKANQFPKMSESLKQELQQFLSSCGTGRTDFTRAFAGELYRLKGEDAAAAEIHSHVISVFHQRNISEYISFRALRLLGEDPVKILNNRRKPSQLNENAQ